MFSVILVKLRLLRIDFFCCGTKKTGLARVSLAERVRHAVEMILS
jgi:hypothetical protein